MNKAPVTEAAIVASVTRTGSATKTATDLGVSPRWVRMVKRRAGIGAADERARAATLATLRAALKGLPRTARTRATSVASMVVNCKGNQAEAARRLGVSRAFVGMCVRRVLEYRETKALGE